MGQKVNPKGFRLITTQQHLSEWYTSKTNYPNLLEEDYLIRERIHTVFNEFLSISKIEITRISQEIEDQEYVNLKIHALFPRAKDMSRKITTYFQNQTMQGKVETRTNLSNATKNQPESEVQSESSSVVLQERDVYNETNTKTKILDPASPNTELSLAQNASKENLKAFTTLLLKQNIRNLVRSLQVETNKNYYVTIQFIKNPFEDAVLISKFIAEQLEKRIPFRRAVKQTIKKVKNTNLKGVKVQVSGRLNGNDMARSEWKRNGRLPLNTLNATIDYTHQIANTIYGVIGIKVWLFSS